MRALPLPTTRSPSLEAQQQGLNPDGESQKRGGRKWHQVVVGVGANIGSMMMTEDMVRGLRYCLEWLKVGRFAFSEVVLFTNGTNIVRHGTH